MIDFCVWDIGTNDETSFVLVGTLTETNIEINSTISFRKQELLNYLICKDKIFIIFKDLDTIYGKVYYINR